jgi:vacuolar-type H+-ATPase subunit H
MEKDLLGEVIEAEKEIQKCLELEKVKSREWLEQTRKEFEEEVEREEKNLRESLRQAIEQAAKEAEAKASDIVRQAERTAGRLTAVKNDTLSRIVGTHVRTILPG